MQVKIPERGLESLTFQGREYLDTRRSGIIRPVNYTPKLERAGRLLQGSSAPIRVTVDKNISTIKSEYDWGTITASYTQSDTVLRLNLSIQNTQSDQTIKYISLNIAELAFSEEPMGRILEAGMWGTGGKSQPLSRLMVRPDQAPPIIEIRQTDSVLVFTSEESPTSKTIQSLGIPFATDQNSKHGYSLWVSFPEIAPDSSTSATVSLRFGPSAADIQTLAGDVLRRFRESYPFTLNWPSRRPIGAIFLAASQKHPSQNPRGWFQNSKDINVISEAGLPIWRSRLMNLAEDSIKVLKNIGAQGMITWDPEGQEYTMQAFTGPQPPTLAPNRFAANGSVGAMDEYFAKFREAGFRTGIAIRLNIIFQDGVPFQG